MIIRLNHPKDYLPCPSAPPGSSGCAQRWFVHHAPSLCLAWTAVAPISSGPMAFTEQVDLQTMPKHLGLFSSSSILWSPYATSVYHCHGPSVSWDCGELASLPGEPQCSLRHCSWFLWTLGCRWGTSCSLQPLFAQTFWKEKSFSQLVCPLSWGKLLCHFKSLELRNGCGLLGGVGLFITALLSARLWIRAKSVATGVLSLLTNLKKKKAPLNHVTAFDSSNPLKSAWEGGCPSSGVLG